MVGGEEERDQSQELTNEQPPVKKRRLVEPETMVNFNTGMLCVHTHTHTGTHAHTHSLPTHTQAHTHTLFYTEWLDSCSSKLLVM